MRWLSDLAGSLRASFGIGRATISAASLTAQRTVTLPDRSVDLGDPWEFIPLGVPFDIWTHLPGVELPPTDNPNYRYIKLTASDSYNDGVLTSESVSGSAPLVQATAVIDYPASPFDGETVHLINTERRVRRAGSSGTVEADAFQGHRVVTPVGGSSDVPGNWTFGLGAPLNGVTGDSYRSGMAGGISSDPVTNGTNGTPRTANETRVKSIGADVFMRIR